MAVQSCATYDHVRDALEKSLGDLGFLGRFAGQRVLLKVSLMRGTAPPLARTTHPALLEAVIRLIQDQGGDPIVVESSGILGFTDEVCEAAGLMDVIRRTGARWRNLDAGPFRLLDLRGSRLREVYLPRVLWDCDLRVTLPKLKTHTLTGYTGALKNQVGLLPGGTKCGIHLAAPSPTALGEAVADINRAVPFDLGIVDGIVGLEGGGSAAGRPHPTGIVTASADLVALDAVTSSLVGIPPSEVPTTVAGVRASIGRAAPDAIELVGRDTWHPVAQYGPPARDLKRHPWIARATYRKRGAFLRPVADRARCQRCGECVWACPVANVTLEPWPTLGERCVHCFACRERCPSGAMGLTTSALGKRVLRSRSDGLPLRHLR